MFSKQNAFACRTLSTFNAAKGMQVLRGMGNRQRSEFTERQVSCLPRFCWAMDFYSTSALAHLSHNYICTDPLSRPCSIFSQNLLRHQEKEGVYSAHLQMYMSHTGRTTDPGILVLTKTKMKRSCIFRLYNTHYINLWKRCNQSKQRKLIRTGTT